MHSITIPISHKKIFQRIKYKFLYSLDFELNMKMKDPDWLRASEANQIIRILTGGSGEPKVQAASIRGASSVREEKPILQKWVNQEETQQAVDMPLNGWQQQAGNDSTCIIAKLFFVHSPVLRTNWYFSLIGPQQKETTFHLIRHPMSKDLDKKRPLVICLLSGSESVFDLGLLWGRESTHLWVELVKQCDKWRWIPCH